MGDAAGIGPEVVARALLSEDIHRICRPLVIGETGVMERTASLADREVRFRRVNLAAEVEGMLGRDGARADELGSFAHPMFLIWRPFMVRYALRSKATHHERL